MSNDIYGTTRTVRSRKEHRCDLCDWPIPKGDLHVTWTLAPSMWEGDSWFTGHTHVICEHIYRASGWFEPAEPMPFFADFWSEILAYVTEAEWGDVRFEGTEEHRTKVMESIRAKSVRPR